MMHSKIDYFGSNSPLGGSSSAGASPSASEMISPASSSVATSQRNSPSTSACTSVSDLSSEAEKLSLANAKASRKPNQDTASQANQEPETSEAAAIQAQNRRVEEELDSALAFGTQIVQREARALAMAAKRLSKHSVQQHGFRQAVRLVMRATTGERGGKVVLTGVGKSGIIAKKLSATLLSLGTPSMFLHPTEALHGDLGMLTPHRDVVIALSYSGSSSEILSLVPHLNARRCPIIALAGKRESALVKASDAWIDCATGKDDPHSDLEDDQCESCDKQRTARRTNLPNPSTDEAWDDVPAPSSSTTVALAMGDALAFSVTRAKGLARDMFAFNHPGGKLGTDFVCKASLCRCSLTMPKEVKTS
ncbi:hypothetical protein NDA18_002646 [Ustilago nuda]|nr:hypothetical protein NDA18_002646 [Ustilago nuda]